MRTLIIRNIDCENCARKIEKYLESELKIEKVQVNLIANKMLISDDLVTAETLNKKISEIEKGVVVVDPKGAHNHDHNHDHSSDNMLWRLLISGILFIIGIIINNDSIFNNLAFNISYLIVGYPVIMMAFKNMRHKQFFDEFFLMTIATLAAISIGDFAEAAAVMLFYSVGEYIQAKSLERTKASVTELESLRVKKVNKIVNNNMIQVNASELNVGDMIFVEAGEKVGLDAVMIEEKHSFNTAHLTGESKPVIKRKGKEVLAGSIVNDKGVKLQVLRIESESTIAKLIDLITYADSRKSKSEQFVTRFSKVYTPIVVYLTLALLVILPLLGVPFEEAVYRGVTLLVISCPCALVLSVPLGYVVAIGRLAKEQILVKGSNAIDQLVHLNVIASDKTGTLTTGKFGVSKFENLSSYDDDFIHALVYAGEKDHTHPIAKSLTNFAHDYKQNIDVTSENIAGIGIKFTYNGMQIEVRKEVSEYAKYSCSAVYINDVKVGIYYLQDEIKPESINLVNNLNKLGIKLLMLTGDNHKVANEVASDIGINLENVYSDLMPEDKLKIVEDNIASNQKVGFIGDGINDAAVIKRSDVGISMGLGGSALAIENSDIVISNDDISGIIDAVSVSRKADRIIKQNIAFAIIVKVIFIVLGIFGFTTMWEAVFSDVGVTLIAIVNSLRIRR